MAGHYRKQHDIEQHRSDWYECIWQSSLDPCARPFYPRQQHIIWSSLDPCASPFYPSGLNPYARPFYPSTH